MNISNLEKKISNPEEDLEQFREVVEKKSMGGFGNSFENLSDNKQLEMVKEAAIEHKDFPKENVEEDFSEKVSKSEEIILNLREDEDDETMEVLAGMVNENGILNTIKAIENTQSFHIKDDFHRFLVQYVKSGYEVEIKEKSPIYPGLNMVLFEVSLPENSDEKDKEKDLTELLSSMEQFYAGMFSVSETGRKNDDYFTIEIAYPQNRNEVVFFCAIPKDKKNIFKNQVLAIFPNAIIKENTDDYNIFNKGEDIAYSEGFLTKSSALPIKTYKDLNYDPLNIILQSFTNLDRSEGAAIQLILSPDKKDLNSKIIKSLDKISKGEDLDKVIKLDGIGIMSKFFDIIEDVVKDSSKKKEEKDIKDQEKRNIYSEELKKKNTSRFYKTNLRLISAGNSESHAKSILAELESSFHQFENPLGNKIEFKKFSNKKKIRQKVQNYTFRVFDKDSVDFFNTTELTSIFHFPEVALRAGDILSTSSFSSSGVSKKISNFADEEKVQEKTIFSEKKKEKMVDNLPILEKKEEKKELNYSIKKEDDSWSIQNQDISSYIENTNNENISSEKVYMEKENILQPEINRDTQKNNFSPEPEAKSLSELKEKYQDSPKPNKKINTKADIEINTETNTETNTDFPSQPQENNESKKSSQENLGDASFSEMKNILLGFNEHQGVKTNIYMKALDRMRHMYVIGKSGVGKTNILKNMIIQDIQNGDGCCFIDPHGSDIEDILSQIPKERYDDVIYFDPTNIKRPMGMNMLEYDPAYPEQKSFVVDELFGIFKKLYSGTPESMGPAFEQYFRNATLLVLEHPESGCTMIEISRVLSDEAFRNLKLKHCKNMIVKQFWEKIATQAGGDSELANIVPYITNKFDVFLANDFMRPIIAQEKSAFNFRDIMDNKKILLVNLSKGKLGDLNSNLIGLILVGKILMAALSRVDSLDKNLPPFYLYIDEFQNVTTDSISQILSEARKYKLSLNIAHQYINQIEEGIRDAVFGNVGSMAVFRVGPEDAEFLEKQFTPTFSSTDILNLNNYNAYLKILVDGEPQKPFNIQTIAPSTGNLEAKEYLKELGSQKYGIDREIIEEEVNKKFQDMM